MRAVAAAPMTAGTNSRLGYRGCEAFFRLTWKKAFSSDPLFQLHQGKQHAPVREGEARRWPGTIARNREPLDVPKWKGTLMVPPARTAESDDRQMFPWIRVRSLHWLKGGFECSAAARPRRSARSLFQRNGDVT